MMQPTFDSQLAGHELDAPVSLPRRVFRNLAAQDWILSLYLVVLLVAISVGNGPHRETAFGTVAIDLAIFSVGLILTRGDLVRGIAASTIYRFGIFLIILL